MSFAIYGLFKKEAPEISTKMLAHELRRFFENEEHFSLSFDRLPFSEDDTIVLRWNDWLVHVSYEEGVEVQKDSAEIAKILNEKPENEIFDIKRRVRMVFGSDDSMEHTNQIIFLLDFFREMQSVILFDPQQNDLIS